VRQEIVGWKDIQKQALGFALGERPPVEKGCGRLENPFKKEIMIVIRYGLA
jgi:hypothetical protein